MRRTVEPSVSMVVECGFCAGVRGRGRGGQCVLRCGVVVLVFLVNEFSLIVVA